ncbi:MAG: DUF971 domain-containing protein [Alphaproteobacteria bacterium]|nr:DUF971 domain-containing protein [Alphaproteobacteria bacterium]
MTDRDVRPRPTELRYVAAEKALHVTFDDGRHFALPAEYLRVESPSAEVQGHSPTEKRIVPGKRYVGIAALEAVGHYAVRILFNDGHDTGLYSWSYLYELGLDHARRWARYESAIADRGQSRELG